MVAGRVVRSGYAYGRFGALLLAHGQFHPPNARRTSEQPWPTTYNNSVYEAYGEQGKAMALGNATCLMCDARVEIEGAVTSFAAEVTLRCRRCGRYRINRVLSNTPYIPSDLKTYLSSATRQADELGKIVLLTQHNLSSIAAPHENARVSQKVEKTLRYLAANCRQVGMRALIDLSFDFPVADCAGAGEFNAYLLHLCEKGLAEKFGRDSEGRTEYAPTIEGWQYLEPRSPSGGVPGRCFVAMSFDPSLDDAYNLGIKPAISECGFKVICMKEISTNEGITDRILAEIRQAQFVVADFTGQRGGVYFEAGFARGLGREVIWCCQTDDLSRVHFDIKHFGHVVWDTPDELREKLTASIRANIIPER
jgi:hypothetical protein